MTLTPQTQYCTYDDVVDRYHPGYLDVTTNEQEQTEAEQIRQYQPPDVNAVTAAIQDASAYIDSQLNDRYNLPFDSPPQTPPMIRSLAAIIAGCMLGRRWPGQFNKDAWRTDYHDALCALDNLASGKMNLPGIPAKETNNAAADRHLTLDDITLTITNNEIE